MASAVDLLLAKIASILHNEASLLGGIRDELEEIKHELVSMRSFLEDADTKRANTEGEKTWVADVRDLAYDVEDIIDEFMYHVSRGRSRRYFRQAIRLPKVLWERHQIANKLQKIKTMIRAIPERNRRYGIDHIEGKSSHDSNTEVQFHGESSFFNKDDDLVGIEDEKQLLVGWLTEGEQQRTTISVVGMGGSGKTTLVTKVYNSQTIRRHFNYCAWINVSQSYAIEDLFRSMIKQFYQAMKETVPMDLSTMNYKQLVEMLVEYLEQKRYIVVLDDVWNINLWNEIKVALPNGRLGSRVLLTTRKEDIASLAFEVGSRVHHIQPLGKNEAWILFCMKAFPRNANKCPPELEILAKDILQKCQGLPLAIVSLGCLLSAKKLESEWRMIFNGLNWELSNNPALQPAKSILLLSYNDLPYRLKYCFLYCCLFPEDCLIRRKRLTRLWMAEGLIEEVAGVTPEEVAERYLMELIHRSMLLAGDRNSCGLPKACKMHDLLRELALSITKKEKFCVVYDEQGAREGGIARRMSVQRYEREIELRSDKSKLRSFLLFVLDVLTPCSLNKLLSGFKLMKVLDLEDAPIEKLPNVVTLFNLRYLNLKGTHMEELPKNIGKLLNLQTLNMDQTKIKALPGDIVKLQNLRFLMTRCLNPGHFYDFNYISGIQAPSGISNLKNLQVLGCIEATSCIVRELQCMTQLVRLDISKVKESYEMDLCTSIQNMVLLRRLFVMATNEEEVLRMDALSSPPPYLRRLSLVGKLEKVPGWFRSLQSLRVLHLHWSRLIENPLPHLQALQSLRWLILVNAHEGQVLNFAGGFDNIEILELHNCPNLLFIHVNKGVLSSIKELHIGKCMNLKRLPVGIEHLTNLQELTLFDVSKELVDRIRGEKSVDRPRVRHIPKINHVSITPSGWSQESLS